MPADRAVTCLQSASMWQGWEGTKRGSASMKGFESAGVFRYDVTKRDADASSRVPQSNVCSFGRHRISTSNLFNRLRTFD